MRVFTSYSAACATKDIAQLLPTQMWTGWLGRRHPGAVRSPFPPRLVRGRVAAMRPLIRTDVPELEPALRGERHEEVHRRAPLFALGLASALLACTWLLLPTRAQSEVRVQAPVELTADGTRVVQLFGDMPVGRVGPDGRPVPQSEELRCSVHARRCSSSVPEVWSPV